VIQAADMDMYAAKGLSLEAPPADS